MRWNLHHVIIEGRTNDAAIQKSWQTSFASLPASDADPQLRYELNLVAEAAAAPPTDPQFRQGDLLAYYINGHDILVHFPRFGQLRLDLAKGTTRGGIVAAALTTYGVLEDLLAIGLSPHLRRRGLFLIHAFAAVYQQRAVLLVGGIGAGKTTTGISLLNAGWQLLSNDSPIINEGGTVLRYPGVLAAFPDSLAHFETAAAYARQIPQQEGRKKLTIPAEQVWPNVWCDQAPIGAILFPRIADGEHQLTPLSAPETLRRILPHAVEQWDKPMMPAHLAALSKLVEQAPGYDLALGPDVLAIPNFLAQILRTED